MQQKEIRLEIDNHKIAVSVYINDIIVFSNRFHQQPSSSFAINQWVFNGLNDLRINLSVNPIWNEELKDQSFDLKIMVYEGNSEQYTSLNLKELHWKYTSGTQFPVNLIDTINLDVPFEKWSWHNADILYDEIFDINSLKTFISNIYEVLNTKNYPLLEPILLTKSTELANAYSIPLDERLSDQKDFFVNELFRFPTWGLLPLTLDNLTFQYHAGGRLIEVLTVKGKSPIESVVLDDSINYSLDLFLCHKNNQWILCR
jgi:hypothetical protein